MPGRRHPRPPALVEGTTGGTEEHRGEPPDSFRGRPHRNRLRPGPGPPGGTAMSEEHEAASSTQSREDGGATSTRALLDRIRAGALLSGLTATTAILWRVLVIAVVIVGLYYLLSALWVIVLPLILALLVASILWPVNRLLRTFLPRAAAAAAAVLGLLAALVGVGWAAAALSVDGVRELSSQAVDNVRKLGEFAETLPFAVPDVDELITSALSWLQTHAGEILSQVFSGLGTVGSLTITVVLALVLTFFCLKDGDGFSRWLLRWTTGTVFVHVAEVSSRSWRTLSSTCPRRRRWPSSMRCSSAWDCGSSACPSPCHWQSSSSSQDSCR
ncbi:AI-2E family transporter [Vibrio cholerae]|nr:AI-2E family transporter [Vibrio cholerae]